MLVVHTKDQLKQAQKSKVKEFIVVGNLADDFKKANKLKKVKKRTAIMLASALGVGVAAAPFTLGASAGVASFGVAAAAAGGLTLTPAAIYAAIAIGGISTFYALHKNYDVSISVDGRGVVFNLKNNK